MTHEPSEQTFRFRVYLAIVAEVLILPKLAAKSRIGQWQRGGYPEGVNIGRGEKCEYTPKMLWQGAVMAEMSRLRFSFQTAAEMLVGVTLPPTTGEIVLSPAPESASRVVIDASRLAKIIRSMTTQQGVN